MKKSGKTFTSQLAEGRAKEAVESARGKLDTRSSGPLDNIFGTGISIKGGSMLGIGGVTIGEPEGITDKSMRQYLQALHNKMTEAGVSDADIDNVLRPLRKAAFNMGGATREERTKVFTDAQSRVEREAQQEIKISLTPEASRWMKAQNPARENYTRIGKNGSQYTEPYPPVDG